MALVFNNLIINKNSKKYRPFLFNLISGRRRLLNHKEFETICAMWDKDGKDDFNIYENELFDKLVVEKQFVTNENRSIIENKLLEDGYFDIKGGHDDNFGFSIELTKNCNMQCSYCYAKPRLGKDVHLTKEYIDAMYDFYVTHVDNIEELSKMPEIMITGGEPLYSQETIGAIRCLLLKWPNAKIILLSNGVNLLKYYEMLPLDSIKEVHISLDGPRKVHMNRRYSEKKPDYRIYDDIVAGIKKLLADEVVVVVKTALDKSNYPEYSELKELLTNENISNSPCFHHKFGPVLDFSNALDLNEDFNSKWDVFKIQEYISEMTGITHQLFQSASKLHEFLGRPKNELAMPEHQKRCCSKYTSRYYFSCDGNVYFCDCIGEKNIIIGTFYPNISINQDEVDKLLNRSVMTNSKCRACAYKFVCLGGCPLSAVNKGEEMTCGIFADEEILDNLEYNYR